MLPIRRGAVRRFPARAVPRASAQTSARSLRSSLTIWWRPLRSIPTRWSPKCWLPPLTRSKSPRPRNGSLKLAPEKTTRLCLGGAFTKDGGQRALVKHSARLIAVAGCFLECASRMMRGAVPELASEVVIADSLYEFDRCPFGIDEMPEEEINQHAGEVANSLLGTISTPATARWARFSSPAGNGTSRCRLKPCPQRTSCAGVGDVRGLLEIRPFCARPRTSTR